MKIVSTRQIRELDRMAMTKLGIPGRVLMERAGRGVARAAAGLCSGNGPAGRKILLVAGRGNNGGDAFAAAVFLREWAYGLSHPSSSARNADLPRWLDWFNRTRPHSALNGLSPLTRVNNLMRTHI